MIIYYHHHSKIDMTSWFETAKTSFKIDVYVNFKRVIYVFDIGGFFLK